MDQTTAQLEFCKLVDTHRGIINQTINKFSIHKEFEDDLRQEILAAAWQSYPNYRGEAKFSTWLWKVARNQIMDYFRRASNKFQSSFIEYRNHGHDYPWDEYIEYDPSFVLERLSDKERECFMLYAEGMSYDDMSEKLGEPANRLRVRISRIRTELKQRMKKHFFT
jgi:RNA polymerase sigma-70 factor (ECF subfamily)